MRTRLILALAASLLMVSCSGNPDVAKRKYVDRGNSYAEKGKYKEALIMYRNALKKDPKFGEAYYRAALTTMKMDPSDSGKAAAARDLHRAIEFQPDNMDAYERLINIYIELFLNNPARPKRYIEDLKSVQDTLQKRYPT